MSAINSLLTFFGFNEDEEDNHNTVTSPEKPSFKKPNITQINNNNAPYEIRVSFPKEYEDSINIATHLQNNAAVLVNIKYLDPSTSKRLIDFLCGTAYAINGNMKKVTDHMFIFAPKTILIEMADDISDISKATQEYESYKIENVANFS